MDMATQLAIAPGAHVRRTETALPSKTSGTIDLGLQGSTLKINAIRDRDVSVSVIGGEFENLQVDVPKAWFTSQYFTLQPSNP